MEFYQLEKTITPTEAEIRAEDRARDADMAFDQARDLVAKAREVLSDHNHEFSVAYEHVCSALVELGG